MARSRNTQQADGKCIIDYFAELPDPRKKVNRQHKLLDVVVITVCAAICGADEWTEVEDFGCGREEWFRQFLDLPNGIPSHDTFGRVFSLLDPQAFQTCLFNWVKAAFKIEDAQVIAIDGKTARRSGDGKLGKKALHMVSAWATANHVVLGQVKTEEKSNEITAIPELLALLNIKDCTVTIDAMGCQKNIARMIIDGGGHYIFGLKGNQSGLLEEAKKLFSEVGDEKFDDVRQRYRKTIDRGHGRREVREHLVIEDLMPTKRGKDWPGLRCFGRVTSERTADGKTGTEERYYVTSLPCNAKVFAESVRAHWGIENSLHWCLDVAFNEDDSRIRIGNAQENMGILRRFTMGLLKNEKTHKRGIKNKRKMAGWSNDYLLKVLGVSTC